LGLRSNSANTISSSDLCLIYVVSLNNFNTCFSNKTQLKNKKIKFLTIYMNNLLCTVYVHCSYKQLKNLIHSTLYTVHFCVRSEFSLNTITFLLLLVLFPLLLLGLPRPNPSPPATIPAFPEQSNLAGCRLDLPSELFHGINSACDSGSSATEHLHRTSCCPALAAWLYSALVSRCFRKQKRSMSLSLVSPVLRSLHLPVSQKPRLNYRSYS